MHCDDMTRCAPQWWRPMAWAGALSAGLLMAGCEHMGVDRPAESKAPAKVDKGKTPEPVRPPSGLGAPATPRSLDALRQQAARRLVAANASITYTGKPPPILLAIPVLTVELHADGSVRRIEVMRYPRQARDTVEIAKQAVYRAAPFGDVSRLPKPWKFNETFLFNDQRKFKPMTLDQ